MSIPSGCSFGGCRVTLYVHITVDYDGPNLLDTGLLSGLEDTGSESHHSYDFSALDVYLESERQEKEKLLAAGSAGSEDNFSVGDEGEMTELLSLDPKE
jgi:hypothetical protein